MDDKMKLTSRIEGTPVMIPKRRKRMIGVCSFLIICFLFFGNLFSDRTKEAQSSAAQATEKKHGIKLRQTVYTGNDATFDENDQVLQFFDQEKVSEDTRVIHREDRSYQDTKANFHRQFAARVRDRFDANFKEMQKYVYTSTRITTTILQPVCEPDIDLIIMVTSRPQAFFRRYAVRNSWGRPDSSINEHLTDTAFTYQTIFTLGRHVNASVNKLVELEHKNDKDILRLDYQDTYENLTSKTLLTLEWLASNCRAKYVLKTDDDFFVNIIALSLWVPIVKETEKYIGNRMDKMPIVRDPQHKNYVPFEKLQGEYYKPYCSGGGYMLAWDILPTITLKSKTIHHIVNEDAYMGLVAHSLDIEPKNDPLFYPYIFNEKSLTTEFLCGWKDQFLLHGVDAGKQLVMQFESIAVRSNPTTCNTEPYFPDAPS